MKGTKDRFLLLADELVRANAATLVPGAFLVDIFPFCTSLPLLANLNVIDVASCSEICPVLGSWNWMEAEG